ncbi:hypothetical protein [Azospirillum picis]|uniref:Lipoprotein n=1 Tax=Azospirillum picis TaxID=488438 RepID=A0ABU0MLG1_9PROT|nr:hypothetical protein [Azospirillum picis]MBP2301083.1 hypothetical protein [Azospirillum picis]MDQ0534297.1 hypothetical protein [Azospirillum picis]
MRKNRGTALAAIAVLLPACAPATPTPPLPAEARPISGSGAYEQRLDDVIGELRDALDARYGRLEVRAYRLPAGAGWPGIAAHYQAALHGWDAEPALPGRMRAGRAQTWKRHGDVIASAFIDTPFAGQDSDYTMLVVAMNS